MATNADDGGSRRFLVVQLPEPLDQGSEPYQAGFRTIAEISRRRVSLAGDAQLATSGVRDRQLPLDCGFRTFRLAETNFSKWRVTSEVDTTALEQHLLDLRDSSSADGATADDLLVEILLKQGYSLTERITSIKIDGLDLRAVLDTDGDVAVLAYLNEHEKPSVEQLRAIVDTMPTKLVILEDAFQGDDELKTNLVQLAKSKNVELWTA